MTTKQAKNIAKNELTNFIHWCEDQGVVLLRAEPDVMKNSKMDDIAREDLIAQYYDNFSLRSHQHVEFSVVDGEEEVVFRTLSEAVEYATKVSLQIKGKPVEVEVVVYSKEGANWYAPNSDKTKKFAAKKSGVSVFEKLSITAKSS